MELYAKLQRLEYFKRHNLWFGMYIFLDQQMYSDYCDYDDLSLMYASLSEITLRVIKIISH